MEMKYGNGGLNNQQMNKQQFAEQGVREYNQDCQKVIGTDRTIIDTMTITTQRLDDVESKLWTIHNFLFGPEPIEGETGCQIREPNVSSLAGSAFTTSNKLERMCDEIYRRLAYR